MPKPLPVVSSIDDECQRMGRCPCGGGWAMTYNEVVLQGRLWVDRIAVRCGACASSRVFEYDISRFFQPRPRVWADRRASRSASVLQFTTRAVGSGDRMPIGAVA